MFLPLCPKERNSLPLSPLPEIPSPSVLPFTCGGVTVKPMNSLFHHEETIL